MSEPDGTSVRLGARTEPREQGRVVRHRVLVVDDDRVLLRALGDVLARRLPGVDVELHASPFDALRAIEHGAHDVVISDLVMDGLDGLGLLARVRVLRPSTLFVLITGASDRDVSIRALRGGAYDFIQKPVDPDYLVACTRRAIEARALRAEVARQDGALRRHAAELEQTVLERTEELSRANRAKDEFLATVSHELRTPLTAVLGWATLLASGKLQPAQRSEAMDSIARNSVAQSQLIDDLLDVSHIATGEIRLERAEVDLASLIESSLSTALPAAIAKNVSLEATFAGLGSALGDASRLQQVLWNLLSNAVKFTPLGGHVAVRAARRGDRVEIEVRDDGVGIERHLLPFVLDRFVQGHAEPASRRRGLGLGLAISRHLVELHGGKLTAESDGPGLGSVFRVTLPAFTRAADGQGGARVPAQPLPLARGCLRGVRVLVVDDEPDTRDVLRLLLEQAGASVEVCAAAPEAWALADQRWPDLLLCDLGLNGEDGYSLFRELRGRTDGRAIRAVALTGRATPRDRARVLAEGFDLHVAKPGPADLPALLATLLAGAPEPSHVP